MNGILIQFPSKRVKLEQHTIMLCDCTERSRRAAVSHTYAYIFTHTHTRKHILGHTIVIVCVHTHARATDDKMADETARWMFSSPTVRCGAVRGERSASSARRRVTRVACAMSRAPPTRRTRRRHRLGCIKLRALRQRSSCDARRYRRRRAAVTKTPTPCSMKFTYSHM